MLMTTQFNFSDHEISKTFGIVMGNIALSPNISAQFTSSLRAIFGGEAAGLTNVLHEARDEVFGRIQEEAAKLGADAVVGVQLTTSHTSEGYIEVMAYGTAVKLK